MLAQEVLHLALLSSVSSLAPHPPPFPTSPFPPHFLSFPFFLPARFGFGLSFVFGALRLRLGRQANRLGSPFVRFPRRPAPARFTFGF